MQKKTLLIGLIVLMVLICCICSSSVAFIRYARDNFNFSEGGNGGSTNTPSSPVNESDFGGGSIDVGINSINNDNISPLPVEQALIPEISILADALRILESNGWDGKLNDMPINFSDFDEQKWDLYVQDDEEALEGLRIDSRLNDIYLSSDAQDEITDLTFKIREEYINALKEKGVASKYINELDKNVMPDDKDRYFFYFVEEASEMPTQVEAYRPDDADIDYTKHQMHLNTIDFHNGARLLRMSGVLGNASTEPSSDMQMEKELRDMAMRWYIYHELTHSLQRAYMNLNVSDEYKNTLVTYTDSENTLMYVQPKYLRNWGSGSPDNALAENFDLSTESQAEGISFELFTEGYDMSSAQKKATWDHLFGRLDDANKELTYVLDTLEEKYPVVNARYFVSELEDMDGVDAGEAAMFERFMAKASRIAPYTGYFNPLRPGDTDAFWDKLGN